MAEEQASFFERFGLPGLATAGSEMADVITAFSAAAEAATKEARPNPIPSRCCADA